GYRNGRGISFGTVRLPAGRRSRQGPERHEAVGPHAGRVVRDRGVRPEDGQTQARDPEEPRARLAGSGSLGEIAGGGTGATARGSPGWTPRIVPPSPSR